MSKPYDDLWIKTQRTNHLATSLERMASAGATMPHKLANQLNRLQHLTAIARPILATILGQTLADSCQVVYATNNKLTISLLSITAVNHARYLQASCFEALISHEDFACFTQLNFIVSMTSNTQNLAHQNKNIRSKKPLNENIKQTITQTLDVVITNQKLRSRLLTLMENINVKDENNSSK